jgi:hypothetical protein
MDKTIAVAKARVFLHLETWVRVAKDGYKLVTWFCYSLEEGLLQKRAFDVCIVVCILVQSP